MDRLSKEQRHKAMSHIRSKDTSIEIKLRKELWRRGYRYRKNYQKLPGKPDIALTKQKIAVFCDSEFFHGGLVHRSPATTSQGIKSGILGKEDSSKYGARQGEQSGPIKHGLDCDSVLGK